MKNINIVFLHIFSCYKRRESWEGL